MACYKVWYGLAGKWYGLAGMIWYMVWPGKHVVYGMALRALYGVWYSLAGLIWYILVMWPGGH